MTPLTAAERVRAFGSVVLAALYFYLAQAISVRAANGLADSLFAPLVERAVLLFLLVVGYAFMGRVYRQPHPVRSMGLDVRAGWKREFALGAAMGWGMLVISILPLVLSGGLIVTFWAVPRQFGIFMIDFLLLAVAALAEEVAFRGYPFQRLIDAIGPTLATICASFVFAGLHLFNPSATRVSFWVTLLASWLLSIAYLRTRALWVCWGWHFAWNASMALLFGLPLSGTTQFSPVIQSNTIGPVWLTGGDYGPEGSQWTALVLLIGVFVVYRSLRHYAYLYAQPVIVGAGIPVDIAPPPQHAAVAAPAPAGSTLVQIVPLAPRSAENSGEPEEQPE